MCPTARLTVNAICHSEKKRCNDREADRHTKRYTENIGNNNPNQPNPAERVFCPSNVYSSNPPHLSHEAHDAPLQEPGSTAC